MVVIASRFTLLRRSAGAKDAGILFRPGGTAGDAGVGCSNRLGGAAARPGVIVRDGKNGGHRRSGEQARGVQPVRVSLDTRCDQEEGEEKDEVCFHGGSVFSSMQTQPGAKGRKKTFPQSGGQPRCRPIRLAHGGIWSRDALVADLQPKRDEGVASPGEVQVRPAFALRCSAQRRMPRCNRLEGLAASSATCSRWSNSAE